MLRGLKGRIGGVGMWGLRGAEKGVGGGGSN